MDEFRALPHYYEPGHLRALSGWINSSYFFPSQIFLIFYIIHWYNGHCRGAAKIAVEEYGRRKAGRWTDILITNATLRYTAQPKI